MDYNKIIGSLLGGAIGDSLGYFIEFDDDKTIFHRYGKNGISKYPSKPYISDDTQMTLFTLEANLNSKKNNTHIVYEAINAYKAWFYTQFPSGKSKFKDITLVDFDFLNKTRAPGFTCTKSLDQITFDDYGEPDFPINNSKGCGAVMRMAPVGFFYEKKEAFDIGCKLGALTHGHSDGFLSAGVLAYIISSLKDTDDIEFIIKDVIDFLKDIKDSDNIIKILNKVLDFKDIEPTTATMEEIGEGWVGEEALAMALYCFIYYKTDFNTGLIKAVNHKGDSDSVGSIYGNLVGFLIGKNAIDDKWLVDLEITEDFIMNLIKSKE